MMTAPISSWSRERARLLGEEHKVRLGMLAFLSALIFLRPEAVTSFSAVAAALGLLLLTALVCIFGLRPHRLSASSTLEVGATAVGVVDLVSITLLVYGTGGAASSLYLVYAMPLIFAGAFFRGIELALLSGLTCGFYSLLFIATSGGAWAPDTLALRLGVLMLVVWQSYALTVVLQREKQGNDQLLRHLAEGVAVIDSTGQIVLVNQALSSMFAVPGHELEGASAAEVCGQHETLRWVLEDVISADTSAQGTTRVAHFPEQDLPILEVSTISCHEHSGHNGGWVVVCRDLRDARAAGVASLETECDEVSPLANLRALSQMLYGLAERLDEDERWRAVSLIEQHTEAMKTILSRLLRQDCAEDVSGDLDRVNLWGLLASTRRVLEVRDRQLEVAVDFDYSNQLPEIEAERGSLGRLVLSVARELLRFGHPSDRLRMGGRAEDGRMVIALELCPCDSAEQQSEAAAGDQATEAQLRRSLTDLSRLFVQCGALWRVSRASGGHFQVLLSIPLQRSPGVAVEQPLEDLPPTVLPGTEGLDLLSQATFSKLNNMLGVIRGRAEMALISRKGEFVEKALVAAVSKSDELYATLEQISARPRVEAPPLAPLPAALPSQPEPGHAVPLPVLIVDDEEGVRELLVQMFEAFGCEATAISGAQEAIDYLHGRRPSLVVADLIMPGASGVDVLNQAREMYPDLPVVIMSGAGRSGVGAALGDHKPTSVLAKPFSVSDVEDLARQLQAAAG